MLSWLARTAELLVGQAPQVAADLLREAVASSAAGSADYDRLVSRLADALYRAATRPGPSRWPARRWRMSPIPTSSLTCTGRSRSAASSSGSPTSRWPRLNQALDAPGISARHRARLFVLGARTYSSHGEMEKAGQLPRPRSQAATEAGDNWAIAWALHVLTIVTTMQGRPADALPLFDRALGRDRGRSGADRPAAAAADQQGRQPGRPGPVRGSVRRGPARRSDLRPRSVPSSGWRRRRPHWASCPSTPGDGTTRWRDIVHVDRGTRGGVQRPRHRRGDLLPSRRFRRGAPPSGCRRTTCRADRKPCDRPAGARPKPGPGAGRACPRRSRADRGVRRQHASSSRRSRTCSPTPFASR